MFIIKYSIRFADAFLGCWRQNVLVPLWSTASFLTITSASTFKRCHQHPKIMIELPVINITVTKLHTQTFYKMDRKCILIRDHVCFWSIWPSWSMIMNFYTLSRTKMDSTYSRFVSWTKKQGYIFSMTWNCRELAKLQGKNYNWPIIPCENDIWIWNTYSFLYRNPFDQVLLHPLLSSLLDKFDFLFVHLFHTWYCNRTMHSTTKLKN